MITGALIAEIAKLVGEPARATMLSALLDGRALTATKRAFGSRVTPQTAQAAPDAIRRLSELMRSEDERVAVVACNSVLDRGSRQAQGRGGSKEGHEDAHRGRDAGATAAVHARAPRAHASVLADRPKTMAAMITVRDGALTTSAKPRRMCASAGPPGRIAGSGNAFRPPA
jgi:hypothetical protein